MSFRGRLTLFFVAIVVVPMIAVGVLVVQVTNDSRNGKADARLAGGLADRPSSMTGRCFGAQGRRRALPTRNGVTNALAAPNVTFLNKVAEEESAGSTVIAVRFYDSEGELLADAGPADALAASRRPIDAGSGAVGDIEVAALDAEAYLNKVDELTGVRATVVEGGDAVATTVPVGDADAADGAGGAPVDLPDGEVRAAALVLDGAPPDARLVLTTRRRRVRRPGAEVAIVLLVFFALATSSSSSWSGAATADRDDARGRARIGEWRLHRKVPAEGNDEIAGLAREFNKMSDRLSEQMQQLQHQREELDQSVRRIGEAFASGLDRSALLEIVIETALAACDAESGQDHAGRPRYAGGAGRGGAKPDAEWGPMLRSSVAASRGGEGRPRSPTASCRRLRDPLFRAGDEGSSAGNDGAGPSR